MSSSKVRLFFICVAGFILIQFLFILKVSEPYPAIKFPGFGSIPQTNGQIEVVNYELFIYSHPTDSTIISAYDLFVGYPKTYIPGMLSNVFEAQQKRVLEESHLGNSRVEAEYREFQQWVNGRLAVLYNKDYEKLVIRKLITTRDLAIPKAAGETKLSDRAVIALQ